MRVLMVGGGGREHALVWKLSQSPRVDALFCAPGNGGISDLAVCVDENANDVAGLIRFSKKERIDFVVVGPENPLASGIVDAFEAEGIRIFGPRKAGALIETSKIFAKELMAKHQVPTAPFEIFEEYRPARDYVETLEPPYVIKADGLCAGKGAYVIKEKDEGGRVLKELLVDAIYGDAGKRIVIEGFLRGVEASYIAFTDGSTVLPMLPSQDHKALLDNDEGPNTGGMGAYTPVPFVDKAMGAYIDNNIMIRTVQALRQEGVVYKGALFGGLMIENGRPNVLEFNARLGDPETQPLLFKMESDILPVLLACAEGNLGSAGGISWKEGVSVCVVLCSRGYPEKPEKGKLIKGLDALKGEKEVMVFHAGTRKSAGDYYTSGGRVLGVTAIGSNYQDAIKKAYDAVSCIEFDGMQYRKDIGRKAVLKT